MTDLTQSQWREIEKASVYLPGQTSVGRYIGLGVLKTILKKSKRTNPQNALLHALIDDAIEKGGETLAGWTHDDVYEWLLGTHFGWERQQALGVTRMKPRKRGSRATKNEFSDLVETFVREMATHGIVLELPGDGEWPQ